MTFATIEQAITEARRAITAAQGDEFTRTSAWVIQTAVTAAVPVIEAALAEQLPAGKHECDDLIAQILRNAPDSFGVEADADNIAVRYVRWLEADRAMVASALPPPRRGRPRKILSAAFARELAAAGVIHDDLDCISRVVIVVQSGRPVVIYTEHVGDERLIDLAQMLPVMPVDEPDGPFGGA